jgi:hypothetical protein
MLMRRIELSVTTNVSAEYETATFAKPLLNETFGSYLSKKQLPYQN